MSQLSRSVFNRHVKDRAARHPRCVALHVLSVAVWCLPLLLCSAAEPEAKAPEAAEFSVAEIVQRVRPSVVTIQTIGRDSREHGLGTGFVISSEGLIATNLHVIGEGREFAVELADGTALKVLSVHASDRHHDLAVIRVDASGKDLAALDLGSAHELSQGEPIVVMGNPLGLRHSVVNGIVSAIREVEGQEMIQLAMPIEPGNSGGPVLTLDGRVHGIVNMKSLRQENVGFAIDAQHLRTLLEQPNPIALSRWATLGAIDRRKWTPLFGARWRQQAGRIQVSGLGEGFGGRSLCVYEADSPRTPFEVAVTVKLGDESGAAGLIFHSDGGNRSYGFYPTGGRLRLTCFQGPTVYSWRILEDVHSEHYRPGEWNQVKVRVTDDKLQCFLNDQLVIESRDRTFTSGKVGLAKFRHTEAEFKQFQLGHEIAADRLDDDGVGQLSGLIEELPRLSTLPTPAMASLIENAELSRSLLHRQAADLERRASELRKIAADLHVRSVVADLARQVELGDDMDLLRAALLLAKLDEQDIDIDAYVEEVERMAAEIEASLPAEPDTRDRLAALRRYLFEENGFHGSRSEEYYHRANSYLNRVIDDREGIPITLSVLYMELGKRIGLDIRGVGLPGHFIVKQVSEGGEQLVDVFDRGKLITREDAAAIVRLHARRELEEQDLEATPKRLILVRMIRNLGGLAETNTDAEALLRYVEALVAISPESGEYREQRARLRAFTQRYTAALEDVDWLLEQQPADVDLNEVHALRSAIRQRVQ